MVRKIIIEDAYMSNNEELKKKVIRRNLINLIKAAQEQETRLKAQQKLTTTQM